MLTALLRNAGKRKGKNNKQVDRPAQSPDSTDSFASPGHIDVFFDRPALAEFDLEPRRPSQSESYKRPSTPPRLPQPTSPRVQLEFSAEDWFPQQELQQIGKSMPTTPLEMGPANSNGSSGAQSGAGVNAVHPQVAIDRMSRSYNETTDSQEIMVTHASSEPTESFSQNEEPLSHNIMVPWKKSAPAPIKIPNADLLCVKVQIQRSASMTNTPGTSKNTQPQQEIVTSSRPPSLSSSEAEDMSAISGTTLARALIANSFILSSDARTSRRSGIMRQDSATLPRGDHPSINSPYWRDKRISGGDIVLDSGRGSPIPPVPPVPTSAGLLFLDQKAIRALNESSRSIGTSRRHSFADLKMCYHSPHDTIPSSVESKPTSPSSQLLPKHSTVSRRISRISEVSSPAPTTPRSGNSVTDQRSTKSGSSRGKKSENDELLEVQSSSSSLALVSKESPRNPPSEPHDDNGLDEYSFVPPGQSSPPPKASGSRESNTSYIAPLRPIDRRGSNKNKHLSGVPVGMALATPSGQGRVDWTIPRATPAPRVDMQFQDTRKQARARLLPIGERPRSSMFPQTPASFPPASPERFSSISQFPLVPSSAVSPGYLESPKTSRDSMAPASNGMFGLPARQQHQNQINRANTQTIILPHDANELELLDEYSMAAMPATAGLEYFSQAHGGQTFPETPCAFSPLWSPQFPSHHHVPRNHHVPRTQMSSQALGGGVTRSVSGPGDGHSAAGLAQHIMTTQEPQAQNASPISLDGPSSSNGASQVSTMTSTPAQTSTATPATSPEREHGGSFLEIGTPHTMVDALSVKSLPPLPLSPETGVTVEGPDESQPPPTAPPVAIHFSNPFHSSPNPTPIYQGDARTSPPMPPQPSNSPRPSPVVAPQPDHTHGHPSPSLHAESFEEGDSFQEIQVPTSLPPPPSFGSVPRPRTVAVPVTRSPPSNDSSPSFSPSFIAPPPYHSVVSNNDSHSLGVSGSSSSSVDQTLSQSPQVEVVEAPPAVQLGASPQPPLQTVSSASSSARTRRSRPPLPIGPRKPSGQGLAFSSASFVPGIRDRQGSVSSINSNIHANNTTWRKLYMGASTSPPKFQTPRPKWRGFTLEAAQWTFSSQQLQSVVSSAIRQSAEASSIRLLRQETIENDIPEEMHRLEMLKMDIKTRYKLLTRKRWSLMGSLAGHVEGVEVIDTATAIRIMEELSEISMTLDQLADELHSVTDQLSQLRSLQDVHSASALAMALRKLNSKFLAQIAETQMLGRQVASIEAERDEAWKQAHNVAQDFDNLNNTILESSSSQRSSSITTLKSPSSARSSRITAVRKSSIRLSKAGLLARRSQLLSTGSSGHRASMNNSSSAATKFPFSPADIPPVPPIPHSTPLGIVTSGLPTQSSMGACSSIDTSSSDARALAQAQKELYDMLGITVTNSETKHDGWRRRSLSGPTSPRRASLCQRPLSELNGSSNPQLDDRKAMLATLDMLSDR